MQGLIDRPPCCQRGIVHDYLTYGPNVRTCVRCGTNMHNCNALHG